MAMGVTFSGDGVRAGPRTVAELSCAAAPDGSIHAIYRRRENP